LLRVSPMQFQCTSMPGKTETSASASPPPTTRLGRRRVPAVPLHPLLPFPVPEATGSSKRTPACREPLRSSARDPPPEGAPRTDEDRREPPRGGLLFSDADKQALRARRVWHWQRAPAPGDGVARAVVYLLTRALFISLSPYSGMESWTPS
jgi:hypothetical protein